MVNNAVLHEKITEIIAYFHSFCLENRIKYFVEGGSALGLKRYNGFIPWDDDFDVVMDRENYEKFLELSEEGLNKQKLFLQREQTPHWPMYYSKLRLNNTTYIENKSMINQEHNGVFIDIFCLSNASNSRVLRRLQQFGSIILNAEALKKKEYQTNSMIKKFVMRFSSLLLSFPKLKSWIIRFVQGRDFQDSELVAQYFGGDKYSESVFSKKIFGKGQLMQFQNVTVFSPEYLDDYLEIRFGSKYMIPLVKNNGNKHLDVFDANNSYYSDTKGRVIEEKMVGDEIYGKYWSIFFGGYTCL